jgi:serine protease Do
MNRLQFNRGLLLAGVLLVFGLGGAIGAVTEKATRTRAGVPEAPAVSVRPPASAEPAAGFSAVVAKDLPAVVNVSTSKVVKVSSDQDMFPFMDPFFRRFFGNPGPGDMRPRSEREHALGSGVIVTHDGYILTNNHVVEKATQITVALSDKREFKARVVGTDPKTDVAVLKVEAKDLPTLTFADSSKVQVGEYALAIGNPFGVGQTVTLGIVSAVGRGNLGIEDYEDFIQTDAAINPGNSGGALVNSQGDLIGLNTAIISPGTGGNNGVGFAIPSNLARSVMDQLVTKGKVTRAYLGVTLQPVTPSLAKAFGLSQAQGALVGDVNPNTPASLAGLQPGDVVVKINGEPVEDSNQLRNKVSMAAPGTEVALTVLRGGAERTLPVTLGEMPANYGTRTMGGGEEQSGTGLLDGVTVQNLTPQARRSLNLPPQTTGAVVTDVQGDSPAAAAGLQPGDVIQSVNRKPVTNVAEFQAALAQAGKDTVLLRVNRGGNTLFLAIESR